MCGLAGIFSYADDAKPVDRDELLRIRERMLSRGPDGAGLWISADQRLGLAHRRLAIIDLSPDGAQPMATADERYQIVFNGEIYNYRELREELQARGAVFRSQSDTEVLLQLYAYHGPQMCGRLRGMYAFAIWDAKEQTAFLARDPFGIKPLYLHDDGKTLRFASQVKALLAGGAIPRDIEPAGHVGYWIWGYVPEPWTLYRDVLSLEPGTCLTLSRGGRRTVVEFESVERLLTAPASRRASIDRAAGEAHFREALIDSVRHHLIADVPVGVFLSAGIDSGVVSTLAAQCGSALRTLTLGFEEYKGTPADETPLAAEVARHCGAVHETVWLKRRDFEDELERFLDDMDQPSTDGANTWLISRAAARVGLKVALSGLGGDEFFAGYPSFRQVPRIRSLTRPFGAVPRLGRILRGVSVPFLRHFVSEKFAGLPEYGPTWNGAYLLRRATRMPWELKSIASLDSGHLQVGLERLGETLQGEARIDSRHCPQVIVSKFEASRYMRSQLLRDADWAGMAHSVEIRVPLVDIEVVRHVGRSIAFGYCPQKRDIAAVAQPALPAAVLARPKSGFVVPTREWLQLRRPFLRDRGLLAWQQFVLEHFPPQRGKRVLLLTTDAYGGHGGIALYNRDLAEALAAMPEVQGVVVVPRTMRFESERLPDKVRFIAEAAGSKWRYVVRTFQLSREDFDILICGHINLLPLAAVISRIVRSPLVLLAYGIDVWRAPALMARLVLPRVSAVWSISAITRDRMNVWAQIPTERYTLLPNAIHLDRYGVGKPRQDLMDRYGLSNAKVLLTVARLPGAERYKGVDEVLEVLPELLKDEPRLRYLVVGDGDDRPRLEAKARSLGLAEYVHFAGLVPEQDKADYFRLADVFVMPGRGEGFGFVFLEALACGIPAVGSTLDGSREALRDGELGELVDPTNPDSIRAGIMRALIKTKRRPAGLQFFAWPAFVRRVSQAVRVV